eukprot:c8547_g1_i5.p1 GENE.c8547_g1_i5~~c8547_g1_i5.p1  ORF type:complete len:539 (+),score=118.03 c8547_g1_i5:134-1750(+)
MQKMKETEDRLETTEKALKEAQKTNQLKNDRSDTTTNTAEAPVKVEPSPAARTPTDDTPPEYSSKMGGPFHPKPYFASRIASEGLDEQTRMRQEAVKKAMGHAWKGYSEHAWGLDELRPLSLTSVDDFDLGLTLVDSLDTLWLMGMTEEFKKARDWVAQSLDIKKVRKTISVFETTIRVLGGLLSAYELSGDDIFLTKAIEIADCLSIAYRSPTGIPYSLLDLRTKRASNPEWAEGASILAEAGTVQLEFRALSRFSGNDTYAAMGDRSFIAISESSGKIHDALYPLYIRNDVLRFVSGHVGLGAMGDSFYEYAIKLYIQTNNTQSKFREMYEESARAVLNHLVRKSSDGFTYIADIDDGQIVKKMDHLACFAGAMFLLGAHFIENLPDKSHHIQVAEGIGETCYNGYRKMKTGIAPELWIFPRDKGMTHDSENLHYLLRPETVETLFYLFRFTGNNKYREWGWEIFQNIEKFCKVPNGYSGIRDVTVTPVQHTDKMESFFLAETLKYLYLLFSSPKVLPLDEFVFNTEAHPYRIFKP